jgi:hypothetical protein
MPHIWQVVCRQIWGFFVVKIMTAWMKRQNQTGAPRSPQRTRISCYAAPDRIACAAFCKESSKEFDNANNLDRKSGVGGKIMIFFLLPEGLTRTSLCY